MRHPSAWLPIAMSLAVLAIMLIYIATLGVPVREADEGTGAHLFQIWMVLEILSVAFFTIKWLPRNPKQTLMVLALQIVAIFLPMAIVFFLNL
ncbi:MAG: hypothetical protein ABSF47_03135 [Minisyncoccia bacterium]|jgi:hypothetical protein